MVVFIFWHSKSQQILFLNMNSFCFRLITICHNSTPKLVKRRRLIFFSDAPLIDLCFLISPLIVLLLSKENWHVSFCPGASWSERAFPQYAPPRNVRAKTCTHHPQEHDPSQKNVSDMCVETAAPILWLCGIIPSNL